ncbi:MAG: 50S ribosomal protein L11 methyltransferase [Microthrixaceae bacterium]
MDGAPEDGTHHIAVAVALRAGDDPELVADGLFLLGATAVLERSAPDGGVELVAELPADIVDGLPTGARVLGPAEDGSSWVAPPTLVRCGRRLVVRATQADDGPDEDEDEDDPSGPDDVVVQVEAGQAFGTGSHASTRLCLELLEPLAPSAMRVLDVGCGTGVLGVASLLLGAGTVRAIDIDPVAVRAAAAAAARNGVAERVMVDDTPLSAIDERYDLVLANLLAPILESLGPDLVDRLSPGASLVVGGVLEGQLDRVAAALPPLRLERTARDEDWVAAIFRPPS